MSTTPNPPSLDHLATRPFSFYPPIVNVEHNEWLFRRAEWSEILVVNCKTEKELWISRRYLGAISKVDDPVLIVGLNKELEYKGGAVWPHQRRVIEMPPAVNSPAPPKNGEAVTPPTPGAPPSIAGMRIEAGSETRIFKLIGIVVALGILLYLGALNIMRVGELRQRVKFTTKDQTYLELSGRDDYFAVLQKIGKPAQERWQTETGAIQYQALAYPDRGYTVILMGSDRKSVAYIGTLDSNWNPVHSVDLRSGGNTFPMLRGLQRF